MARGPSPALRRRELGARLRAHRIAAGLTVDEVAKQLLVSAPKISRLETAQRGISLRDDRDLAGLYGLPTDEVDALMRLARDSQRRSSWQQYSNQISDYAELEEAAIGIYDYESSLVPALLQTEEYARALASGTDFSGSPEGWDQAVQARLARQRLLTATDRRTQFTAIMDEAALRRVVGDEGIMRRQLQVLAERARWPDVTLQVIPFSAGAHPGMDSTFILLEFDESVGDVIYVEGLVGSLYLKSPADASRYREVLVHLAEMALGADESLAMIRDLAHDPRVSDLGA